MCPAVTGVRPGVTTLQDHPNLLHMCCTIEVENFSVFFSGVKEIVNVQRILPVQLCEMTGTVTDDPSHQVAITVQHQDIEQGQPPKSRHVANKSETKNIGVFGDTLNILFAICLRVHLKETLPISFHWLVKSAVA